MMTAKVFENGRSQVVILPKECRFSSDEIAVNKIGDVVILMPKENNWFDGYADRRACKSGGSDSCDQ